MKSLIYKPAKITADQFRRNASQVTARRDREIYGQSKTDVQLVDHYVAKFSAKMTGSLPSESAWWVDGTNQRDAVKLAIWDQIQDFIDHDSRDRGAENGDWPTFINNESK